MGNLFLGINLVFSCQPFDDVYVKSIFHNESSCPRSFCIFTLFIYRIYYRQVVSSSCVVVVFTECRCCMNYTCTILDCNVICACHEERFLVRRDKRHQLFILNILQILALHLFDDFIVFCSENLVCKNPGNVEHLALFISCSHLHFNIINVRTYCQGYV